MPQTKEAAALFYAGAFDMYANIVNFFSQKADLVDSESAKIMEKIDRELERFKTKK
jgi:hypothetical protein